MNPDMNPEELQKLKELIEFLKENEIAEYASEKGDQKLAIKFASAFAAAAPVAYAQAPQAYAPAPAAASPAAASAAPAAAAADPDAGLHIVTSPIVGTFYESSSPGSAPFAAVGDKVEAGQVLCIVEAMKLMNEIESDAAGEIIKRFVNNGQPIEYGQKLFAIRPRS
jgi:acetyl-CoA carboxylase biotin carboxyl carrier protein